MKSNRVYGADFGSYALWLGVLSFPLLALAFAFAKLGWLQFQDKGMILPLVFCLAAMLLLMLWLSRYRLVFTDKDLSYRSWRRSWTCPYTDIAGVSASRVQPISQIPIGAYVNFKNGQSELIYTKAFSRAAIKDLFSLPAA
ncbi:hypothetical protein [Thermomonas aquatica]|uniref:PH domain-containing protein n=1 Tax=Thermomonas aquatica TaxID=2202149 RepID=A0A5B7ZND3_9GAMM|nr:hypothetical protein [Thermomonas aquatica]QDA56468.1 hypothetical protein FHQ07_03650 [Thermomonas aquatica]